MSDKTQHPGAYVREHVIPNGMNVTEAAKLINVSRPALSNFLNGKADLSSEMAARLELAFGFPARKLLELQSAWDAARAKRPELAPAVKSYVPPFLQIRSRRIEEWAASGIAPRHRLSVLLRMLVNSTASALARVDFPGNDASERPGWDGEVETLQPTPWIPAGRSVWEFGINQDPKKKADGDFAKSVAAADVSERKQTTFVFVTPRSWPGKAAWAKDRNAEKLWKEVRAYDSSDLEQWLEQSIPAQIWFANETAQVGHGSISLDEAWKTWVADSEPALQPSLFEHAVKAHRTTLLEGLSSDSPRPIIVTADSRDEALAFLSSAFSADDAELGPYRDRIIVFQERGTLSKLAAEVSSFIPVITSRDVEKEFAPYRGKMPSLIIYPRNATASKPNIALETLNFEAWERSLKSMDLKHEQIVQLSRETGRSPTVLRRRLSRLSAIQTPDWASDKKLATMLIPFLFAGAWKADNKADKAMLEALAGDVPFDELERRIALLLPLDSTPVWSAGWFRGIVSKVDILFAIGDVILTEDLQRFFEVADLVLSEDNPALELPEEKQWAAGIYGKTREISGALREGLAETLVLLAVHGPSLFKPRLSFDTSVHANRLVRSLLTPVTARKLEAQTDNLPLYSEAAPETFLSIIQADLDSPEPQSLALMRPMGDAVFGRSPRTGLLWALENLAWSDELLIPTVLVLGRLAERSIEDNLVNKPIGSLSSIFRSWMPQTSANLEHRKAALAKLAEKHPSVAWQICVEQFSRHSDIGHHSHKPRWRPDGHGYGNPITVGERNEFALYAFRLAANWPHHTRETIGDLVANLDALEGSLKLEVWDKVDAWTETAEESDRAWLREKIRVSAFSRRAVKRRRGASKEKSDDRARQAYDRLQPRNPILRHEWLFRKSWVEESWDEITAEDFDYRKRDERIAALRKEAVREVFETGGADAVLQLAEMGEASHNVGWSLAKLFMEEDRPLDTVLLSLAQGDPLISSRAQVISGALTGSGEAGASLLRTLIASFAPEEAVPLLVLAPFERSTWDLVDELGEEVKQRYWKEIEPGWNRDSEDLAYAVAQLVAAGRPRAAFAFARFDLKELPPEALYKLLGEITHSAEPPKTYMLDAHYIHEAFDLLNASGQFSTDAMSGLEFHYIDVFDREDGRLVNLEKRIETQPDLFVQAVAFAYKRDDGGEDPPELRALDEDHRSNRALASYKLLQNLRRVPSAGEDGVPNARRLLEWIEQVRAGCTALARTTMGDQSLGKLLSHAPAADDEVWPCVPVRDVLEQVLNEHIDTGLHIALYNARGAHWQGEGGEQERAIAAKYSSWAKAMEYTHPRVAAFLRSMEKSYIRDAEWVDNDAKIARRMRL